MQRATTKLHAVPHLLKTARLNLKNPPPVFVEHAIAMLDGVSDLLVHDLPLAFPAGLDGSLREPLRRGGSRQPCRACVPAGP
jgi:hypothetical protein